MTTIATTNPLRKAAKFLLALPFLGLMALGVPSAHADDHHHGGHHGHYRHHDGRRHHGYGRHRGYHRVRHWHYRHGRRVYYYVNEPYYYWGPGVSVRIGL